MAKASNPLMDVILYGFHFVWIPNFRRLGGSLADRPPVARNGLSLSAQHCPARLKLSLVASRKNWKCRREVCNAALTEKTLVEPAENYD